MLTIFQANSLGVSVNLGYCTMLTKASIALIERVCNSSPNTTSTSSSGEAECGIGTPVTSCLVEDGILGDKFDVRSSDTFSNPRRIHLEGSVATEVPGFQKIHTLVVGTAQTLEIVRAHEDLV
jgi:hypothetical protein